MSTPPFPDEAPLKLHLPGDILAAVPFILGFEPTGSLVAISLKGSNQRVGLVMRTDYPCATDLDLFEHAALNMVTHLQRDEAQAVILIAYPSNSESIPCLVDDQALSILEGAALTSNIEVREALIVADGRWRSTLCQNQACCPPQGTQVLALGESRVAAEVVMRGGPMPFASEAGLISSLAYQDSVISQSLAKSIEERVSELLGMTSTHEIQDIRRLQRVRLDECFNLWCRSKGNFQLFAGQICLLAEVVIGVQGIMMRDYALGIHTDQNLGEALTFWRWLLTIAPVGTIAPIACLVAATAYELGDGALAQRALDRAFIDSPDYSLANLLRRVFTAGLPPKTFAQMRSDLHSEISDELMAG
ncbi:MAG TPA: DUF4192 domain-containing protein [Candidatus Nanopelagicaceae bacterium]|nr:DUF4192 domain-containing protein [Candidatus Nanopelagicaceae bacterium]